MRLVLPFAGTTSVLPTRTDQAATLAGLYGGNRAQRKRAIPIDAKGAPVGARGGSIVVGAFFHVAQVSQGAVKFTLHVADPEEGFDAGEKFKLVDGFGEEIVSAGFHPA